MDDKSLIMKMEYQPQKPMTHILTANEAAALFAHLELRIHDEDCSHTHRFTQEWLEGHVSFMQHDTILSELEDMGGYCDCAVLENCYVDYKL